jgi:thiol-disulfide isomerase/thioredoxin
VSAAGPAASPTPPAAPPGRRRPWLLVVSLWLVGVVVIALVVAYVAGSTRTGTADDPVGHVEAIPVGKRVPAAQLSGQLLGGGTYDPATYAGHIRVVNAWGSWCEPCKKELPILRRLALATYASPVDFLGLDVEDSMADGQAMARQYAVPYPSIYDEDRTLYDALAPLIAPSGVPGTVVIDAQGRVAATVIGAVNEAELSAYLKQLAAGTA